MTLAAASCDIKMFDVGGIFLATFAAPFQTNFPLCITFGLGGGVGTGNSLGTSMLRLDDPINYTTNAISTSNQGIKLLR
jgi:hypothetical protein